MRLSLRGRPTRSKMQEYCDIKLYKSKTQYPATLILTFMIYTKLATNNTKLCPQIRESGFQWLNSLPKTYYNSFQEVKQHLSSYDFSRVFQNSNFERFMSYVWGSCHKVILLEFVTICEEYLWLCNRYDNPEMALTQLRHYYFDLDESTLNDKFRYMRFNVVGVIESNLKRIKENVVQIWEFYILILTKLVYLIGKQGQLGSLRQLYKFNISSEDAFQQEMAFLQIGRNELQSYHLKVSQFRNQLITAFEPKIPKQALQSTGKGLIDQRQQSIAINNLYPEEMMKQRRQETQPDNYFPTFNQLVDPFSSQKQSKRVRLQQTKDKIQMQRYNSFNKLKSFHLPFNKDKVCPKIQPNFDDNQYDQIFNDFNAKPDNNQKREQWQRPTGQGITNDSKKQIAQQSLKIRPEGVHSKYTEDQKNKHKISDLPKKKGKKIDKVRYEMK